MAQSLPPLNALRAFEAAARHLSFTKAADELHVTQAAISHQVKGLEDHLGVKLFRRLTRSLLLTEEGKALLPDLRAAFDQMTQAVQRVRVRGGQRTLNISTMTTFAMSWLVPRLPNFQAAHPDIEVRISTTQRLVDFAREDVDLATRYGFGSWPGLASHKLFDDVLTPLCSPAIAAKLIRPEDLRGVTLLHENPEPSDWTFWCTKFGVVGIDGRKGPRFDSTRIAVQAAIGGLGVAIGAPNVFIEELATGRLVQPFPEMVVGNGKAFWIVYLETSADEPKIRAFRDWILAEATAMRPPPVERLPRI